MNRFSLSRTLRRLSSYSLFIAEAFMNNTAYPEQTELAKPELQVIFPRLLFFNFQDEKTPLYGGAISTG